MKTVLEGSRWLLSAIDRKEQNEKYTHVWGNVATDGNRMHIDKELPALQPDQVPFNYDVIVNPIHTYSDYIVVDVTAFIQAVKAVKCLDVIMIKLVYTNTNKSKTLKVCATQNYPQMDFTIELPLTNTQAPNDFTIVINPKYLLDALLGLTCQDNVFMRIATDHPENKPLLFHCEGGQREAIIMPMALR